jgi:hypothetical protein
VPEPDLDNSEKLEKMRQSNEDLERLVASLPPVSDSAPLIREDRDRDWRRAGRSTGIRSATVAARPDIVVYMEALSISPAASPFWC